MSFWLVQNPSGPLFGKEGYGEILWRIDLFKKSPNPPLPKGEDARKDSRQAGMTNATSESRSYRDENERKYYTLTVSPHNLLQWKHRTIFTDHLIHKFGVQSSEFGVYIFSSLALCS